MFIIRSPREGGINPNSFNLGGRGERWRVRKARPRRRGWGGCALLRVEVRELCPRIIFEILHASTFSVHFGGWCLFGVVWGCWKYSRVSTLGGGVVPIAPKDRRLCAGVCESLGGYRLSEHKLTVLAWGSWDLSFGPEIDVSSRKSRFWQTLIHTCSLGLHREAQIGRILVLKVQGLGFALNPEPWSLWPWLLKYRSLEFKPPSLISRPTV